MEEKKTTVTVVVPPGTGAPVRPRERLVRLLGWRPGARAGAGVRAVGTRARRRRRAGPAAPGTGRREGPRAAEAPVTVSGARVAPLTLPVVDAPRMDGGRANRTSAKV